MTGLAEAQSAFTKKPQPDPERQRHEKAGKPRPFRYVFGMLFSRPPDRRWSTADIGIDMRFGGSAWMRYRALLG